MSVIEIKNHPITHIIVRDFLDSSSRQKLVESLLPIREKYLERVTYTDPNGVERKSTEDTDMFKTGAWLFALLEEKTELNRDCIDVLESNMWRDDLQQAYEDTNDLLFSIHSLFSTNSSILFSQYETGGWLSWHTDGSPVCSASYQFTFKDRQFLSGGDFLLSEVLKSDNALQEKIMTYQLLTTDNPLQEKIVSYPFKDNFLIMFPAKALHKITPVSGYRYSLNYLVDYRV